MVYSENLLTSKKATGQCETMSKIKFNSFVQVQRLKLRYSFLAYQYWKPHLYTDLLPNTEINIDERWNTFRTAMDETGTNIFSENNTNNKKNKTGWPTIFWNKYRKGQNRIIGMKKHKKRSTKTLPEWFLRQKKKWPENRKVSK